MANYGNAVYGISKYGINPLLAYSVEPMSLLVTDFHESYLYWQTPTGTYSRVRIVRNQNSYPETAEDGTVVYEIATDSFTKTSFNDGGGVEDLPNIPPLVPGKPIYYRVFLFTSAQAWVVAGSISAVVPTDHSTSEKLLSYLPRVYTSKEQSPLSPVDPNSALAIFTDAFAFDLEETMTYLDLLLPDHTRISTVASMLPLENANYGLLAELGLPVKNQKQLIREAIYMYTHKGTENGLSTYVEALTGYAPTITTSSNLMLSAQDSTFYQSIGNWTSTNTSTFAASTEQVPSTNSKNIDLTYTCKIVATGAGSMILGLDDPVRKGVPVNPATYYTLSAQVKSPASAGTITPSITYHDGKGVQIGSASSGSATSATNTWAQTSVSARATKNVSVAVSTALGASGTITYTTSSDHNLVAGETVTISGFLSPDTAFNLTGATIAATPTTTTFTVTSGAATGTTTTTGLVVNGKTDAVYASIKLAWSAAGTYYVDMVCVQSGQTVSYDEARAVDIFLNPDKTNFIKNPTFETNVTNSWTKVGTNLTVTQDVSYPTESYSGTHSAKLVNTSGAWSYTSNSFPVEEGQYYALSFYKKATADFTVTFVGRDSLGTVVSTNAPTPYTVTSSASWLQDEYIDTVRSSAATPGTALVGIGSGIATFEAVFSGTGANTIYLDSIQAEKAPKSTDYFDGSLSAISGNPFGAVWQGTVGNSYSSVYNSKPLKVPRLGYTLKDWMPQNSFWRIRSYENSYPPEYTNLTAV
jgi:hypothetical protein